MKRQITLMAATLAAITSCTMREMDIPGIGEGEETVKVQVVPSIRGLEDVTTRSSVTSGESAVNDINIFFYRDGLLAASEYITTPSVATFLLAKDVPYNVYAVANAGRIDPISKESDMLSYRMSLGSSGFVGTLNGLGVPMVWSREGYTPSGSLAQLPVSLVRLVSKIRFRIDTDALAGLRVTAVRLCNGAAAVTPFRMNGHGGSKVTSASEVTTGDYASDSDLQSLNAGGEVFFYALENCQGTLLPGNTDPWKKIPSSISVADLCTYLEVDCEFQSGFALAGTITYRIYLGQDNCSNFDIIRNVDMGVALCLTRNLDNVSWKIDPDVDYNGSLCSACVEQGLHGLDDIYVGETSLMRLSVNSYLEDFIGEGLPGHSLAVFGADGKNSPDFRLGTIMYSSGDYFCEIKCIDATQSSNTLCLVDAGGNIVTDFTLEDGALLAHYPQMVIGDGNRARPGDPISEPGCYPYPLINGGDDRLYIYLADSEGNNLNCMEDWGQYGFDLSLFMPIGTRFTPTDRMTGTAGSVSERIASTCFTGNVALGTGMSDGASAVLTLRMSNTGQSASINSALSRGYKLDGYPSGMNTPFMVTLTSAKAESVSYYADYDIVKPTFYLGSGDTFPQNLGWNLGGETYIASCNPSCIDLLCDVYFVGKLRSTTISPVISNASPLLFQKGGNSAFSYVPGSRTTIEQPYFCDGCSMTLKNTSGTPATIDGKDCRVYVMDADKGIRSLSEDLSIPNRYIRADVGISTIGDRAVQYDCRDLNGGFVASDGTVGTNNSYTYNWGQDGYCYSGAGWYTGPRMSDAVDANRDARVAAYDGYSGRNLHNIIIENPVTFKVGWNTSSKCPVLEMSGNTFGCTFKCVVGMCWTSSCSWDYNTGGSPTTTRYAVYEPEMNNASYKYSYTMSGLSASVNLPSAYTVESRFASINKTYWHENCTNAINLKSNRFSQLAMPESVTYYITIFVENANSVWVPIDTEIQQYTGKVTASYFTFYSNTARGTYADTSSMTNPDGSDRGKNGNVSSQASKYSDYTTATASYGVGFEFLNLFRWNRYNL